VDVLTRTGLLRQPVPADVAAVVVAVDVLAQADRAVLRVPQAHRVLRVRQQPAVVRVLQALRVPQALRVRHVAAAVAVVLRCRTSLASPPGC